MLIKDWRELNGPNTVQIMPIEIYRLAIKPFMLEFGDGQDIATGQRYDLSFMYSPRPGVTGADNNDVRVFWNGDLLDTVGGNLPAGAMNWQLHSYAVVALGNDVLAFAASGRSDSLGGSLDAVTLTAAVPEPGTYALMVAGLLALGFIARRRKAD